MMIAVEPHTVEFPQPKVAVPCVVPCTSCGFEDDPFAQEHVERQALCGECRSPLTRLAFPNYYFDVGGEG
jgi:hypothetical protein